MENLSSGARVRAFLGNLSANYFPADWVTVEATFAYDNRQRSDNTYLVKGYRTFSASTASNSGNMAVSNRGEESMNGSLTATFRRQVTNDLNAKLSFRGLFDQDVLQTNSSSGQVFVTKEIYTLSNTTTNKTATSGGQTIKNQGVFAGAKRGLQRPLHHGCDVPL